MLLLAACGPAVAPAPPPAPVTVAAPAWSAAEAAPALTVTGEPGRRGPAALISVDPGRAIPAMEQLLAATDRRSPDRAAILWRLAEAYAAVAASADRIGPDGEARARRARRRAIDHYRTLAADHPRFCAGSNRGCGDEVLFYLAYELERAKERGEAQKAYWEIIKGWPQSRHLPDAYLGLAEAFFDEGQGDPSKLAAAEQAYQEVLRFPPPGNKLVGYAHYKLGYVRWNRGDAAGALAEMMEVLDYAARYPQLPSAPQLAKSARHDLIPFYATSGDPAKAYDLFAAHSGDRPGERTQLHRMLEEMAEAYSDTGKPDTAVQLCLDWLDRGAGASTCAVVRRIDAIVARAGGAPARAHALAAGSATLLKARADCAAGP
jgi:tetratricopeptide (TPR) repeat protein